MKTAAFEYLPAATIREAVHALEQADGDGKVLAGGQSLVPVLALRLARPALLVDINRVPGLARIDADDSWLQVGALVRHRALVAQCEHPLLAEAARWIGHAAIRSRGTFGGSLAHADPAAELPVVGVACGAELTICGPDGTRTVGAAEFFAGALTTDLTDSEILTGARLRIPERWGFAEFARRHGDFALVTAAVAVLDARPRIVIGGVAGVPLRAIAAEDLLGDDPEPSATRLSDAADAAVEEVTPTGDLHGGTNYRRALAREQVLAALRSTYAKDTR
jgi:carbon-monoxide dehydrogenase medium subunit